MRVAQRDEIVAFADGLLQADAYPDALPVGLQVAGAERVTRIATGVSASLELFRRAADAGAQMLIVHHGLFWKGESRRVGRRERQRLKCLFDADLSLVAYHLALDAHADVGNNALLCRLLGLDDLEEFGEMHGQSVGFIGRAEPPIGLDELVDRVRREVSPNPLVFADGPAQIARVAVISGAAAGEID